MQIKIYAIRDNRTESFNIPTFAKSDSEMVRMIQISIMDGESMLAKFPKDYDLYFMGTYDNETGTMETTPPQHIMSLLQIRENLEKQNG